MRDLKSPRVIVVKGVLFVVLGVMASGMLIGLVPQWEVAALLVVAVWAFARAYYFAFYVIEHYVDGEYRYSGIWSAVRYLRRRKLASRREDAVDNRDAEKGK
jgi:hypothetical protein